MKLFIGILSLLGILLSLILLFLYPPQHKDPRCPFDLGPCGESEGCVPKGHRRPCEASQP